MSTSRNRLITSKINKHFSYDENNWLIHVVYNADIQSQYPLSCFLVTEGIEPSNNADIPFEYGYKLNATDGESISCAPFFLHVFNQSSSNFYYLSIPVSYEKIQALTHDITNESSEVISKYCKRDTATLNQQSFFKTLARNRHEADKLSYDWIRDKLLKLKLDEKTEQILKTFQTFKSAAEHHTNKNDKHERCTVM